MGWNGGGPNNNDSDGGVKLKYFLIKFNIFLYTKWWK